MNVNFAVTGVGGYIAPRHLKAIRDTGNKVIAAIDPHDSVGVLDQYFPDARFFTEFERFDRHLEKLRRGSQEDRVHFVTVCSPNYLHDAHCRMALRIGADTICEKPLVISPWNIDQLQELESEFGKRIYTVLQLRLHPKLKELRDALQRDKGSIPREVCLSYVTSRGKWYNVSWKGMAEKSGGIATNIGIHLFDLLIWLFGPVQDSRLYYADAYRMSGFIALERARVKWFLSVDASDLPSESGIGKGSTYRSITISGEEIDFTDGFADLHTRVYEEILAGRGFGIDDARPSVELAYRIRSSEISPRDSLIHPFLQRR